MRKFAVSTGDIAYDSGTQTNYGNLVATGTGGQRGVRPGLLEGAGRVDPAVRHAPATTAAAPPSCRTGSRPRRSPPPAASTRWRPTPASTARRAASYPSVWYAFNAGGARFYILNADWNDNNFGTAAGGAYQVDRDYHWQPTSPEYQWLKADLESHGNSLKLAFFHYPLRSDSATEGNDTYLQDDPDNPSSIASLEGLLANNGVDLAFNGHAHLYQRNIAPPGGDDQLCHRRRRGEGRRR